MQKETAQASSSRAIPRSFWYSVSLSLACLIITSSLIILSEYFAHFPQDLLNAITFPMSLLSLVLSWIGSKRAYWKRGDKIKQRDLYTWIPLIFSMALAFQFLGANLHSYNIAHNIFVFPAWADAAVLGTYPLLIFGVLCLSTQSLSRRIRLRVLLDSFLVIVVLVTFSWYFLLGPILLSGSRETILAIITHLAFPGFDLLLIGYVILFMAYTPDSPLRFAVRILSLGLITFVLTDSIFQYRLLHGVFAPGWCALG